MTDTTTQSLAAFLLARIAEDEAVARAAWPDRWEQDDRRNAVRTVETGLRGGYEGLHMGVANLAMTVGNYQAEARNAAHIARHDPARVLAECAAKRAIVEMVPDLEGVLAALASIYADHAEFREEWRP